MSGHNSNCQKFHVGEGVLPQIICTISDKALLMSGEHSAAYLTAQLALRDARIAQLELENDALSRRLHLLYSVPSEPATAGNLFWRRYVDGGSSHWRTMFEVCSGGGRLWRAMVRVGRRRA